MADSNTGLVSRQWEASATATVSLSVIDRLAALNRAASQDDVQPLAVIALENLGVLCLASMNLISEGVDALNGNESLRFRDTKLLIGLSNGGTASLLRQSTSCVQSFLLITALEICGYEERDVAEVLYHTISHAGVLKSSPVSKRQLQALVGVISGHCQGFIVDSGAETLGEILNSFADIHMTEPSHWDRPPHEALARILVNVFKALQDENVHYMELSGSTGLIWISLVLFWLNRDKVALFHKSKCVPGKETSKIKIIPWVEGHNVLGTGNSDHQQSGWVCKTWKLGQPVPLMVEAQDSSSTAVRLESLGMIPALATRDYYLAMFDSSAVVEALAAVATTYIQAGLRVSTTPCKYYYLRQSLDTTIGNQLFRENVLDESSVLEQLGWRVKPSEPSTSAHLNTNGLLDCILAKGLIRPWPVSREDDLEEQAKVQSGVEKDLKSRLHELWERVGQRPPKYEYTKFINASYSIAAQALLSLFIRSPSLLPSSAPTAASYQLHRPLTFFDVRRNFGDFWASTMGFHLAFERNESICVLRSFREALFRTAVCGKSRLQHDEKESPVAISTCGRTAFFAALYDPSVEKAGILDVCMLPGNIRFENIKFDTVLENLSSDWDPRKPELQYGNQYDSFSQLFGGKSTVGKVFHDFADDDKTPSDEDYDRSFNIEITVTAGGLHSMYK